MAVQISDPIYLAPVSGIRVATVAAGVRYENRPDLVLFEIAPTAHVAALFTRNRFCAAPVTLCRDHLKSETPRYLLINTGNANAGTGEQGLSDARNCCSALAELLDQPVEAVLPFSTGVIGEPLPTRPIINALPTLIENLSEEGWLEAARGIMTTDTVSKGATQTVTLSSGERITLTGISKGSGMICPNMATMLAFIATDANIAPDLLTQISKRAVERSFNRVTVDGDTSTNDAVLYIATGAVEHPSLEAGSADLIAIENAITELSQTLAQAIVRDGEGATKFVTIHVTGAASEADATEVAYTIAHSPLVKTALFASDPNWGRILAAIGRARIETLHLDQVSLSLGEVALIEKGEPAADYSEADAQAVMAQEEIEINVHLGSGEERSTVWTCDFSYDYVRINADYRS
jgi:glutamate N-acetyltransferase/amino-acid N-acetyltransferase